MDISSFDYVAFADQDDIWNLDKLSRHVNLIQAENAECVSSNVMAFWPDESRKLIRKSQPQKLYDFIFEAAGPGCSFLMTPWLVTKLRDEIQSSNSPAKEVVMHDWLTYAICRAYQRKWVIDPRPSLITVSMLITFSESLRDRLDFFKAFFLLLRHELIFSTDVIDPTFFR